MAESEAVEIVNFQVTGVGTMPKPALQKFSRGSGSLPRPHAMRLAYFGSAESIRVPIFRRSALDPAAVIEGPAIIEEKTSTIVVYPGQAARVDEYLHVEVTLA